MKKFQFHSACQVRNGNLVLVKFVLNESALAKEYIYLKKGRLGEAEWIKVSNLIRTLFTGFELEPNRMYVSNGNKCMIIYEEIRLQKELQPIILEYGWHASAQFD